MAREIYEIERFFRFEIQSILEKLSEDKKPLWGSLSAHQMIEHLSSSFQLSNGKKTSIIFTPQRRLNKVKLILWGKRKFPRNYKNPALKKEDFRLRFSNFEDAKSNLVEEMNEFTLKFYEDVDLKYSHPIFGILMKDEWFDFHYKHILHHFSQFGLVVENYNLYEPEFI